MAVHNNNNDTYEGPRARIVGFKEYDDFIRDLMELVGKNVSREELLQYFIERFQQISTARSVVVLELERTFEEESVLYENIKGFAQRGLNINRWKNFCDKHSNEFEENSIVHSVLSEGTEIDVWGSYYFEKQFQCLKPLFDIEKGGWLAALRLPAATARHNSRAIFVWYKSPRLYEEVPRGTERDWRMLIMFRDCYNMASFQLRKAARSIIMQRQELLRMLAPSILNHEIHSRTYFIESTTEWIEKEISKLSKGKKLKKDFLIKGIGEIDEQVKEVLLPTVKKLAEVSDSIMHLSRRVDVREVDPLEEINASIKLLNHASAKHGIVIQPVESSEESIVIETDSALFTHVIVNLLYNSIEGLRDDKQKGPQDIRQITIRVEWEEDDPNNLPLIVDVEDNGPGVKMEMKKKIFEPGITTKPGGHGLGLAICKLIMSYLGGTIDIYNMENPTIFRMRLPFRSLKIGDLEEEIKMESEKR